MSSKALVDAAAVAYTSASKLLENSNFTLPAKLLVASLTSLITQPFWDIQMFTLLFHHFDKVHDP